MRIYPFGSGSFNPGTVQTASFADYATTVRYTLRAVSASVAINGLSGSAGVNGICEYVTGLQGPTGSVGRAGFDGVVAGPF